jgi:flavodoxin
MPGSGKVLKIYMKTKKTLIICESYHHGNTLKIAEVIAKELNAENFAKFSEEPFENSLNNTKKVNYSNFSAQIKKSSEVNIKELDKYDLIGFGSGIYDDMHHLKILSLVDKLPKGNGKKTFIFSTSGVPVAILGNKFLNNYSVKAHATLKNKLESKGYIVLGEFICPGFNTNVFLKYFGGLNKKRPNLKDFEKAKEFASKIKER